MLFLFQISQNQPLPVAGQQVFRQGAVVHDAAASLPRFQNQVHLGVVAKGLKMAHSFHRIQNGLLIDQASGTEFHGVSVSLFNHSAKHLQLNLTHQPDTDFRRLAVPGDVQLRVFLSQFPEMAQHGMHVHALRYDDAVGHERFQHLAAVRVCAAQRVARNHVGQAGDRAYGSRFRLIGGTVFHSGIESNLIHLLFPRLPVLIGAVQQGAHRQLSPGKPKEHQSLPPFVPAHFEHLCAEGLVIGRLLRIPIQAVHQVLDSLHFQGRPKNTRVQPPFPNGPGDILIPYRPIHQHLLRQLRHRQSQVVQELLTIPVPAEIHEALPEGFL